MAEDLKPEGLRGLLLGPLVLLAELVGALIPGVLFLILLIVKRVPEATAAIGTTFIGYRTKIACGLVISFLIGRLFLIPANLLQARLLSFGTQDLNLFDANKQGSIFDKLTKEGKKLLGGALMTGFLRGATPWEHYMVAMSEGGFRLSTGFALLVACLMLSHDLYSRSYGEEETGRWIGWTSSGSGVCGWTCKRPHRYTVNLEHGDAMIGPSLARGKGA